MRISAIPSTCPAPVISAAAIVIILLFFHASAISFYKLSLNSIYSGIVFPAE